MRASPVQTPRPDVGTPAKAPPAVSRPVEPFATIACPILRPAARTILERWRNETGDATDLGEVRDLLVALAEAIVAQRAGTAEAVDPHLGSPLARRLLELLRAEVVRRWREATAPPAGSLVLDTLEPIERVREAIEPNWAEYFSTRLSAPDGLDLVVEVAHDLRSPLTSILFLAETLQRGQSGDVNDVQRRQLGLIYSAALGLSALASDVIELARGGDRLVDKDPQPFSVTETLESVRDIVRPIAEEKGLAVRLLPPATDHRLGHPLALSRVLLNLTTNALKFTDEGFVEIVTRTSGLSKLEIAVRDTGRGIAPEALESLYQPFRRKPGREGYCFSGTGLGLAICRKLVEAMGATLQVETRPRWGTRFYFELILPPASHV